MTARAGRVWTNSHSLETIKYFNVQWKPWLLLTGAVYASIIKRINLKYTAGGLAIAVIIGSLISWFSDLPFWASFAIVVVAMVLNGVLAEYEDNLPGGFNNLMSEDEIKIEKEKNNFCRYVSFPGLYLFQF